MVYYKDFVLGLRTVLANTRYQKAGNGEREDFNGMDFCGFKRLASLLSIVWSFIGPN